MRRLGCGLLIFAAIDLLLSTLFFAKFNPETAALLIARIEFFNYFEDLIDIWFLGLLRSYIVAGVAAGIIWRPSVATPRVPAASYFLSGYSTAAFLCILVKLLITTEGDSILINVSQL